MLDKRDLPLQVGDELWKIIMGVEYRWRIVSIDNAATDTATYQRFLPDASEVPQVMRLVWLHSKINRGLFTLIRRSDAAPKERKAIEFKIGIPANTVVIVKAG